MTTEKYDIFIKNMTKQCLCTILAHIIHISSRRKLSKGTTSKWDCSTWQRKCNCISKWTLIVTWLWHILISNTVNRNNGHVRNCYPLIKQMAFTPSRGLHLFSLCEIKLEEKHHRLQTGVMCSVKFPRKKTRKIEIMKFICCNYKIFIISILNFDLFDKIRMYYY